MTEMRWSYWLGSAALVLIGTGCGSDPVPPNPEPAAIVVTREPPETAQHGVTLASPPAVGLVDAKGARVAVRGLPITVSIGAGKGTLAGTLEVRTGDDGAATFGDLKLLGVAGSRTLRFSASNLTPVTSRPIALGAGPATTMTPRGNSQTAAAGTALPEPPGVLLADDAGNPVAGVEVLFAVTAGGGTLEGASAITGADGVANVAKWTLGPAVGPNAMSVSAGSLTASLSATGVVGPPAKIVVVQGDSQTAPIGRQVATAPWIKVTDAFDNPVAGFSLPVTADGGGAVAPPAPQTDGAGIAKLLSWTLGFQPGVQALAIGRTEGPSLSLKATATDFQATVVSAGGGHTCALNPTGAGWCWGDNASGELGRAAAVDNDTLPGPIAGGHLFSALANGAVHGCGLTTTGAAFCWGENEAGQVGNGTTTDASAPVAVVDGHVFRALTAGDFHTCGLKADSTAWCWGNNGSGRLGDSTVLFRTRPTQVRGSTRFADLSAGGGHTCGRTASGTAYCWGSNGGGRLGDGSVTDRLVPTLVNAPGITFTKLSAGGIHTCAVTSTSIVMCWGTGTNGVLGTGTTTSQSNPTAVGGSTLFSTVAAGPAHTCGIAISGAGFCWGTNANGRLGDGTVVNRPVPTAVFGTLQLVMIDPGFEHTCATTQQGSVVCWGRNLEGQLGDGSVTSTARPVGVRRP